MLLVALTVDCEGNASGPFLCGNIIQAMIALRNPSYAWPAWQSWLLAVACAVFVTVFNIFGEKILPMSQNIDAVLYVGLWIATIAVLAATGPHVDAHTALLKFNDLGNWHDTGLALVIGQISAVFALGGSDASVRILATIRPSNKADHVGTHVRRMRQCRYLCASGHLVDGQ